MSEARRRQALVEAAISGMVSSLDPHSRYMNDRALRERRRPMASSAGSVSKVTMELVSSRSWHRWTIRRRRRPASVGDLISHINGEAVQGLTLGRP
jgi:carboxyl-terminal processing protease